MVTGAFVVSLVADLNAVLAGAVCLHLFFSGGHWILAPIGVVAISVGLVLLLVSIKWR